LLAAGARESSQQQSDRHDTGRHDAGRRDYGSGHGHYQQQQQFPMPVLYSIHRGTVRKIEPFGAFVELDGFRKHGLVHISQISTSRIEKVDEVLAVGEVVYCKVISLDDGKMALAMRYASQGDGRDLDSNNVQLEMDRQRTRRGPASDQGRPIAVENMEHIVCRRCGGRGHLASNCFNTPGAAVQYDPADDEAAFRAAEQAAERARYAVDAASEAKRRAKEARRAEKDEAKRAKKRRKLEAEMKDFGNNHVTNVEDAMALLEREKERKRLKKERKAAKKAKKEEKKREKRERKERKKREKHHSESSSSSSDSESSDSD
jgi:predicted RNA-binding protein with RPS1 domain